MTDHGADARAAAYTGLLSALTGVREDPASDRFDEELAAAEAAGAIAPAVARTLRWWQRESVRAVEEHLTTVLPVLLATLESSARDARAAVSASAESWAVATGTGGPELPPDGPPHGGGRPVAPTAPPSAPSGSAPVAGRRPSEPGSTPYLRPVTTDDAADDGIAPRAGADDVGAASHRLLVSGLTVLSQNDRTTARGDAAGSAG